MSLLNGNDYDGFCDRQLFVCPPEKDVDFDELKETDENIPDLRDILLKLDEHHDHSGTVYDFDEETLAEFIAYHDKP